MTGDYYTGQCQTYPAETPEHAEVSGCARRLIQDVTETEVINSLKEVPRVKDRAGRCRVDSSQKQNATWSDIQEGQKDLLVTQENNKA